MSGKIILVVGTYDTKNDELEYMAERIRAQDGGVLTMDISVLGDPEKPTDISKHEVAEAAGSSIQAAIESGADWVVLCDTNGGSQPSEVAEIVRI